MWKRRDSAVFRRRNRSAILLIAGIDGGQTSTSAAIADNAGRILGRGNGPPADLVGEERNSARGRAAIGTALADAARAAALPADVRLAAVVIGLTGHDDAPLSAPEFAPFADAVTVVHDAVIAHTGAFGDEPGIVVLAGTGSVALGNARRGEPYVRAGGWGYFFGDHGGALGIAREAILWAMRDADYGEPSQLGEAALRFFGASDLHGVQHAFAHGELSRPALAAFAEHALGMAPADPPSMPMEAWHLRNWAAITLAELVWAIDSRLPAMPARRVSYAGGVFRNEGLLRKFRFIIENRTRGRVRRQIRPPVEDHRQDSAAPNRSAVVVEPAGDPLDGALLLARRLAEGEPVAGWAALG